MKAEHRKQLEKNELVTRLQGLWKGSGDNKISSTVWVVVGAVALLGVLIFAWQYFSSQSQKNRSVQWREIEQATDPKDLESIIESNKGTQVAVAAKAQLARLSFNEGLTNLNTQSQRESAIAKIEKARDLYEQIRKEAKDDKQLVREATMGEARAEESLVGIPKGDNSSETRGSLDKALELYQDAADKFGDMPQGKDAAARAKEIKENKQQIQEFYVDLNKQFSTTSLPVPPEPKFTPSPGFTPNSSTTPSLPVTPATPLPAPPKSSEPPAKTSPAPKLPTPLAPPPKTEIPKNGNGAEKSKDGKEPAKPILPKPEKPEPAKPKPGTPPSK